MLLTLVRLLLPTTLQLDIKRDQLLAKLCTPDMRHKIGVEDVYGSRRRVFQHTPQSLRESYQENLSEAAFLVFKQTRLSFRQVWLSSIALGAALSDRYAITKVDRVAIWIPNYPDWIIAF
ncbi:MAG: hypothetical protein OSA42_08055 [Porticoccaceae bacterium]|nr:hypothetical protein [Porticoccaceae bacterium]